MEEIIVANLTLDTTRRNNIPPLVVPQGDYGARVIRAKITDLGKPVIVESTAAASIVATRSGDGESKAFSGRVNADGTVTVPVKQWMLDVPEEDVTCHIEVTSIVYKYSTTSFLIEPQEKANPTEISEDDPRVDVVTEVLAGENTRRAAEAERVSNENARIAAENARQSAEEQRVTDESTRITNEAQRVSAESSRDATFRSWAQDIASLPTFDGRISANRKRIENLESGIPAESFILDDSVAYTKDVPENVAPNAAVQKVGGMTRKCTNLFGGDAFANKIVEFGGIKNESAGIVYFSASLASGKTAYSNFKANTQYTFIIKASVSTAGGINLHLKYTDGTKKILDFGDANTVKTRLYVSESGKTVESFAGEWQADTTYYYNECGIFEGVLSQSDFEPYFEGLRSAKVAEVKSVGANLFDVSKVTAAEGSISIKNDSVYHQYTANTNYYFICVAEFECKPNTNYSLSWNAKSVQSVYVYTDRLWGNSITAIKSGGAFNSGNNTKLLLGFYSSPSFRTENSDVISNIMLKEGASAPYTPYVEHTLPIPEAVRPANGINENVYDFIEWAEDGSVKKTVKCGVVDLGTLNWYYGDLYGVGINCLYTYDLKDAKLYGSMNTPNAACAIYNSIAPREMSLGESGITLYDTLECVAVSDSNYTDAATFKAAMSGVMLVYELAEPEVTDISDLITADNLVPVQSGGTMTPVNEYGYAVPSTIIYQSR